MILKKKKKRIVYIWNNVRLYRPLCVWPYTNFVIQNQSQSHKSVKMDNSCSWIEAIISAKKIAASPKKVTETLKINPHKEKQFWNGQPHYYLCLIFLTKEKIIQLVQIGNTSFWRKFSDFLLINIFFSWVCPQKHFFVKRASSYNTTNVCTRSELEFYVNMFQDE